MDPHYSASDPSAAVPSLWGLRVSVTSVVALTHWAGEEETLWQEVREAWCGDHHATRELPATSNHNGCTDKYVYPKSTHTAELAEKDPQKRSHMKLAQSSLKDT